MPEEADEEAEARRLLFPFLVEVHREIGFGDLVFDALGGNLDLGQPDSAFSMILRWLGSPQLACVWPPVNPKPLPPPGRS